MTAHTNSYTGCRCDTRGAKGMFSQELGLGFRVSLRQHDNGIQVAEQKAKIACRGI